MDALSTTIAPRDGDYRMPQEQTITLWRGSEVEAELHIYASDNGLWHLTSVGNFRSIDAARKHLVDSWDREPTDEECWAQAMAEATYRAGYAYACGYRN